MSQPHPVTDSQEDMWECANCQQKMDISAFGYFDMVQCPTCSHMVRVHTQIAHFKLEKIIGVGGMSIVLKAYDELLGRHVAVKILNQDCREDSQRIAGFEKECKLMARVQHPNVVKVYNAGRERGYFYFAMELLDGINLESSLKGQKKIHSFVVLKMAHLLAKGLQKAYEMGVLHRDIKPGNILLTKTGEAKLIDFGLALQVHERDDSETIWATPYYAAPETLRQEKEDARADIYSLGMTLRSILTLEDIFQCDKVQLSGQQWLEKKKKMQSIGKRMPELDREIVKLIDRMTQFRIENRHADYSSLILHIEDVMEILQAKTAGNYPVRRYSPFLKLSALSAALLMSVSLVPFSSGDSLNGSSDAYTKNGTHTPMVRSAASVGEPSERIEVEELCAQLQAMMSSSSSSEVLAAASYLSHQTTDPLLQMWGLELKWAITYLESGSDELLHELTRQLSRMEASLPEYGLDEAQLSLKADLLRTAQCMKNSQAVNISQFFSQEDSPHAIREIAMIVQLQNYEESDDIAQAFALLEKLELEMSQVSSPLHALYPQLALTRYRLERKRDGGLVS